MDDNGIDESTIRLNRCHNHEWNPLSTQKTREDYGYVYYSAQSRGFSVFAITGGEALESSSTPTATSLLFIAAFVILASIVAAIVAKRGRGVQPPSD